MDPQILQSFKQIKQDMIALYYLVQENEEYASAVKNNLLVSRQHMADTLKSFRKTIAQKDYEQNQKQPWR